MNRSPKDLLYRFPFLVLLVFLLIAYLPVFLPFFHLKNDVITQNLPTRFFIGESLYSHQFPWWNPYMNFGFPQYADMNNGFWNPVLWFVGYFFHYSVLSITLEEMFYILLGGWGIYLLCRQLNNSPLVCLLCGMAYMSGGFIVGHLQHFCWITGTAFFPYVVLYFLRCLESSSLKNYILSGLSIFLFISSTHPGLIIGSLYFFLFLIIYLLLLKENRIDRQKVLKASLLFLFFGLLFSPIVWSSDIEGILQMTRGSKVSFEEALNLPTTLPSYLSLLFPVAINKGSFFNTDISMRNMSLGIICLVGVIWFFRHSDHPKKWFILLVLSFFILLSAGIGKILFYQLPLLGFVRLNGEFSYFTFFILIVLAAIGLNGIDDRERFAKQLKPLFLIFILSILISSLGIILTPGSIKQYWHDKGIKLILDHLNFWSLLLPISLLQLVFVVLLSQNFFKKWFIPIAAIHLIVLTWLSLPFTGIGQMPRENIQAIINTVPKGIFKPYQKPIRTNTYIDTSYSSLFLEVAFYSKQIGYPNELQYPVLLHSTDSFFSDTPVQNFIYEQPYLFLSTDTTLAAKTDTDSTHLKVAYFSPTRINTVISNNGYPFLIFLQNNYPRWKVYVDNKQINQFTAYDSFIGLPLQNGQHRVDFVFDVTNLKTILFINFLIVAVGLILLLFKRFRELRL